MTATLEKRQARWRSIAPTALIYGLGMASLLVLPLSANAYQLHVLSILLIHILVAVSLNLVMGYIGAFSFAHVAILGLGAYAMGNLFTDVGLIYPLAVLGGAFFAATVGAMVALPALRLSGLYLAVVTLSFTMFVHWLFIHGGALTKGASGMIVARPDFTWIGVTPAIGTYYVVLLVAVLCLRCLYNVIASPLGRSMLCIADQPQIAPGFGINTVRTKVGTFAFSAFIAGLAGGLYGGVVSVIDPASFHVQSMIMQFIMVVVGGLGGMLGAIIGATAVTIGLEALRPFAGLWEIVFGGVLLLTLLVMPYGIYGSLSRRFPSLREARHVPLLQSLAVEPGAFERKTATAPRHPERDELHPAVQLSDVRKAFGGLQAIDGLSLQVKRGHVHGIIGPNGSGKSTLINLISAHYRPDSGDIAVFGSDILRLPEHAIAALGVGRTYQNLHLVKGLTVLENVLLGLYPVSRASAAAVALRSAAFRSEERAHVERAYAALDFVRMADLADRPSNELSGGQMRLVEVARAVIGQPELILMDEPAAGLSLVRIDTLKNLVERINQELGITVVMVEHVLNVVMDVSHRVTVLDAGQVLAEGTPQEIRQDDRVRDVYFGRTRQVSERPGP